jgi:hypothetical protein
VNLITGGLVNEADYMAANGDTLHGTTTGTSTGNPIVVFTGTEAYTSGTGHFASISGEADITGGASFVTGTGFWTTSGTIAFGG